jgi:hypothetical protein
MSRWTHIAGAVRIDGFIGLKKGDTDASIKRGIERALGKVVTYDSPDSLWRSKAKKTPMGSEGGVRYDYTVTAKDGSSMSRGLISIDGDLRDFGGNPDDITSIVDWLNNLTEKDDRKFFIRQGVVEVESGDFHGVIIYDAEEKKFVLHNLLSRKLFNL